MSLVRWCKDRGQLLRDKAVIRASFRGVRFSGRAERPLGHELSRIQSPPLRYLIKRRTRLLRHSRRLVLPFVRPAPECFVRILPEANTRHLGPAFGRHFAKARGPLIGFLGAWHIYKQVHRRIGELDYDQWLVSHNEDRFIPSVRRVLVETVKVTTEIVGSPI